MTEEKMFFEEKVFSREDYEFIFEADKELIEEILKNKKSGKILDLGCGEAGISLLLAKKGFEVTCIDISKTAINNIKKEAKKRGVKINALVEDLEKFEIEEDYDIIIGTGIFHFLLEENSLKLIDNVKKHTKEHGLNVFEVFLQGDPSQEEDSEGYYFKPNELKDLYYNWDILDYEEYEDYNEEEEQTNKIAYLIAKK
ncbi:MAG: methyltransferase domain-containing protein [Nanoarchaeota archaeon]|nr:methyltransferase domain-containing protein [Nanoarchaeota archaeon]